MASPRKEAIPLASIKERSPGHFQITVSCGYYPSGKKHTETMTYIADPSLTPKQQYKAAERAAQDFEMKIRHSDSLDGRKVTFQEFSKRWMEEYAKLHLQPKTLEKYQEELTDKILPQLGKLKLSEIRPTTLNSFFVSLTKEGVRRDGKKGGYSKASIAKTKNIISSILRSAVEWEVIDTNPCSKVRLPPSPNTADHIKFFTPEQATVFLDYIEKPYTVSVRGHKRVDDTGKPYSVGTYELQKEIPEQIRILFNLAIYGGFRKGELLALQFSDIDFENNTVRITKSVSVQDHEQICKAPKTKTSVRTVSIPDSLTQRIARLQEERTQQKDFWGPDWKGDTFLFITHTGSMMNYGTPYQALQDAISRFNTDKEESNQLPMIPFHGLRHTSATLLISANQDIATVSRRLGHAHASVTFDIYTHALEKNDQGATDALESLLKKE